MKNILKRISHRNDVDYDVSTCPCKPYQQCSTLRRLLTLLGEIPKKHIEYSNGIRYIRTKICDKRTKKVYCCNYNPSLASTSRPILKPHNDDVSSDNIIHMYIKSKLTLSFTEAWNLETKRW